MNDLSQDAESPRIVLAADGTPIAYRVRGPDAPTLIFTNGLATSSFYWRRVLPHFERRARLVTWDLKGHGDSGPARSADRVTVADSADDVRRILDALGVERAVLLGFSFGCQIVLEAWRHYPDRIAAIIPILGTYGHPFRTLVHPRVGPLLFELFRRIPRRAAQVALGLAGRSGTPSSFRTSQRLGLVGDRLDLEDMRPFYDHIRRVHGPTWHAMCVAAQDHSSEDLLEEIRCPVLVISGGRDAFTPAGAGRFIAERIPNAEELYLPEATHTGLLESPLTIATRIGGFLESRGILEARD